MGKEVYGGDVTAGILKVNEGDEKSIGNYFDCVDGGTQ